MKLMKRIMKAKKSRNLLAAATATGLLWGLPAPLDVSPVAEAGMFDAWNVIGNVLGTVATAASYRSALLDAGNNPVVQQASFQKNGNAQGITREVDARAVSVTDDVMQRMVNNGDYVLHNNSLPFRWKVVANDEFNAFCDYTDFVCVYDGIVKAMDYDKDELAAVLGHEMSHGYNQQIARSISKKILTSGLSGVALDAVSTTRYGVGTQLPESLINFLSVKNINVADEKRADESGFYTMASAGFNPGGPAAMMAKMTYFTEHQSQFVDFFMPSDHPDTRVRLGRMGKLMTTYGINHPSVKNANDVYFDKELLLIAEPSGKHDAEEMAYLIAGGIAKGFHDNKTVAGWNFHKAADGSLDFLTDDNAYQPLKNALRLEKGLPEHFQSLVEAAYAADLKGDARTKCLQEENERIERNKKLRAEMNARTDESDRKATNGQMYMELGLDQLAEKEFTRAMTLNDKNPLGKSGMATVLAHRGDFSGAMKLANEAIAMNPELGRSYADRAAVYIAMGQTDNALADCNQALSVKQPASVAYKIAGDVFHAQGATENALMEYQQYIASNPYARDIPQQYLSLLVKGDNSNGEQAE